MSATSNRVDKICEQCAGDFSVKRSHSTQRFCALACKTEHERLHGRPAAQVDLILFSCKECSKPFSYKPSYLKAYQKKFEKNPLYCSRACSHVGRRKTADEKNKFECKNCGKETYRTRRLDGSGNLYYQQALCSKQCKNEWVSKVYRDKHGLPKVTRRIKRKYAVLRIPAQNGNPTYEILEHRYIMEQHIGRKLTLDETVHHINGDRFNNDISNLELFSNRHGPGQRVVDKVQFAIEILTLYPEFARQAGYVLNAI